MAQFLTRVELHGAKHGDEAYRILHAAMDQKGFLKTIWGIFDGREYHLPEAEYIIVGEYAATVVRSLALEAVSATGLKAGVVVTLATLPIFDGLKEVNPLPLTVRQYPFGSGLLGALPMLRK